MSDAPADLPPTRAFALPVAGGEIRGDELPGSEPGYLFVHGLGSVRRGLKSDSLLLHAAQRRRRFLRIDQRGHGESSGRIGQVKVSTLVDDVRRVVQHMESCVVVGSSLGGLVAAFAAVAEPQRVRGLCLIAPAFGLLANLERRLDARGELQTSNGLSFPVLSEVLADAHALALAEPSLPFDLVVPTLVVHGTNDDVIPPIFSERFFATIRHAQKDLWIVDGGDHRLVDHAAETWLRLDRLVDSRGR